MKLSKDELKAKIDEKIGDEDLKIELLEDIEDSMEVETEEKESVSKEDFDKVVAERDEIKRKYKERFLSKDEEKEDEKEEVEEGLKEEEVIDVKEI